MTISASQTAWTTLVQQPEAEQPETTVGGRLPEIQKLWMPLEVNGAKGDEYDMGQRAQDNGKRKTAEEKAERRTQRDGCTDCGGDEHGQKDRDMARQGKAHGVDADFNGRKHGDNNADRAEDAGKHQMVQTLLFVMVVLFLSDLLQRSKVYCNVGTYVKTYVK